MSFPFLFTACHQRNKTGMSTDTNQLTALHSCSACVMLDSPVLLSPVAAILLPVPKDLQLARRIRGPVHGVASF
jgi:hypothetical protein